VGGHLTTSAPFPARTRGPVSGRLSTTASWRRWPCSHGFPLRFRCRRSLLGHPVPARELSLPHGWPTGLRPDPDGVSVFHTHELRSGWVPSLLRGLWCSSRPESLTDRHPRPLNRWSLNPATTIHLCGALLDEASTKGSRVFTRPIFPSPVATGWNGSPLAFPRAPHPAITRDARRGGDRSSSTDLNQRSMSST
jgi:hypothetical protein